MGPVKREQLRARDGNSCWWCFKPMDFSTGARATQVPTIEHLEPKSLGGTNSSENLVLCHPGCNKQLADRPRVEKERLRDRRLRRVDRAVPADAVAAKAPPAQVRSLATSSAPRVAGTPAVARTTSRPIVPVAAGGEAPDWQRIAIFAIATSTFFAGLCLGMLVN